MLKYLTSLLFASHILHTNCYSQTIAYDRVNYVLGAPVINKDTGVPFDIRFLLQSQLDDSSIEEIVVEYQIDPSLYNSLSIKEKNRLYFQPSNTIKTEKWSNPVGSKSFSVLVEPLHPNIPYDFKFTTYKSVSLDDDKKSQLEKEITLYLKEKFSDLTQVNRAFLQQMGDEITKKVKTALDIRDEKKLVNKSDPSSDFVYDPFGTILKPYTDSIIDYDIEINKANKNIKNARDALLTNDANNLRLNAPAFSQNHIGNRLHFVLNNTQQLNKLSAEILDKPISPLNQTYGKYTFKDLAILVTDAIATKELEKIILGKSKIGSSYSNKIDVASLELLYTFFNTLIGNSIVYKSNEQPVFNDFKDLLTEVNENIEKIIVGHQTLNEIDQKMTSLLETFPDLFSHVLLAESYTSVAYTINDLESDANPYIGVDFGLVYTTGIESLFLYEGVNIYPVPVNKKTPLSNYESCDKLLKRLSFFVGLTQNLIKPKYDSYEPLIDGINSSVLIGFGYRVTKVIRVNYSELFFNQKNPNPLIDQSKLKVRPSFSVSFDINIAEAFGPLFKSNVTPIN